MVFVVRKAIGSTRGGRKKTKEAKGRPKEDGNAEGLQCKVPHCFSPSHCGSVFRM